MCPELRDNPTTLDFLKKHIPTEQIQFQALAGDASTRSYVRVYNNLNSYILMIFPVTDQKMAKNFIEIQTELQKYNVLVPNILGIDFKLGYLLLEDLGDLTLERRYFENQKTEKTVPFYVKAINELIKIHSIEVNKKNPIVCYQTEFNTEKLIWELHYMKKNLLLDFFQIQLSEEDDRKIEDDFLKICDHLSALPQVICHRDYHSRNIMLHRNETYIIDFQDARLGPCQYDLVSLLRDSYVDIEENYEYELLSYYYQKVSDFLTCDWVEFHQDYKIQILQRTLKACGSFSSFYNQKNDTRYLKHIQPTLKKVKKVLSELNGYEGLSLLFNKYDIDKIECKRN